jgi:hypothetical protein
MEHALAAKIEFCTSEPFPRVELRLFQQLHTGPDGVIKSTRRKLRGGLLAKNCAEPLPQCSLNPQLSSGH